MSWDNECRQTTDIYCSTGAELCDSGPGCRVTSIDRTSARPPCAEDMYRALKKVYSPESLIEMAIQEQFDGLEIQGESGAIRVSTGPLPRTAVGQLKMLADMADVTLFGLDRSPKPYLGMKVVQCMICLQTAGPVNRSDGSYVCDECEEDFSDPNWGCLPTHGTHR